MRRLPMPMIWLAVQAVLVGLLAIALLRRSFPLGVPGEWTWSWLPQGTEGQAIDVLVGLGALTVYAGFLALGRHVLDRPGPGRLREVACVATLAVAAVGVMVGLQSSAPLGFGFEKWGFALHTRGSNGYFDVARIQMKHTRKFWSEFPDWIKTQDYLHIGTHPPGLFLGWRAVLEHYRTHPEAARFVVAGAPPSAGASFRTVAGYDDTMTTPDFAALATVGALTLLACALTVIPLYALVRTRSPAPTAWAAASLWPLVPSALLFQPTADTAFPLLATSALALAAHGRRWSAAASGVVLAIGMQLTLAFLAVGLVVALVLAATPGLPPSRRLERIAWTGAGFLAPTLALWFVSEANPLLIWWANARNHARFYEEFPRTYLAWQLVNPIELAVGLGLPLSVWALVGFWRAGRATWATLFVLLLLQVSGRNLSEVARLWLPLMPPLVAATASGIERVGGRSATLAATAVLVGLQTLILQAAIQVVYPL